MTEKIDIHRARILLADAVNTQGRDFVYNASTAGYGSCFNVPLGELTYLNLLDEADADDPRRLTGCLVGTAIKLAGVPIPTDMEAMGIHAFDDHFTEEAMRYLAEAQAAQDDGQTWGQSHYRAEAFYEGWKLGREHRGDL